MGQVELLASSIISIELQESYLLLKKPKNLLHLPTRYAKNTIQFLTYFVVYLFLTICISNFKVVKMGICTLKMVLYSQITYKQI